MSVIDTTPPGTQAQILRQVANHKHPKLIIGPLAGNHHMTLDELQAILRKHGYPDPQRMLAAAATLEHASEAEPGWQVVRKDTGTPERAVDSGDGDTELGQLLQVPVAQVHPDPNNPRDHLADIEDLAASMLESGLLQPVIARRHDEKLILVAGHRRLAAAKHLKWTTIPCIVRRDMRPDAVLAAMLIENGQRSDLDPIEEARGLNRLKLQLGCSDHELAKRIGRSQPTVSNRLALLALSPEEQEEIRGGSMSLLEAAGRGRLASGRVRPNAKGKPSPQHLSIHHQLGTKAKARCQRLGHSRGKGKGVGGVACGECWESVIRADERQHLSDRLATTGHCNVCGHDEGS